MLNGLSGIPLFDGFDPAQLELLLHLFENYTCPPNTMIFTQGEQAQYLYLILRGHALIQYKPYDGPSITISRLKPGDAFGWSAVVGNPIYSSGILSSGPLQAVRIRGADLARLCHEHPNIGSVVLDRLARGVSGRWKDARIQVQTMLKDSLQNTSRLTGKG